MKVSAQHLFLAWPSSDSVQVEVGGPCFQSRFHSVSQEFSIFTCFITSVPPQQCLTSAVIWHWVHGQAATLRCGHAHCTVRVYLASHSPGEGSFYFQGEVEVSTCTLLFFLSPTLYKVFTIHLHRFSVEEGATTLQLQWGSDKMILCYILKIAIYF